jgi:hypothetical protein
MGILWKIYGPEAAFIFSACLGASAGLLMLVLVQGKPMGEMGKRVNG